MTELSEALYPAHLYNTQDFFSRETLEDADESVAEVFGMMLGIEAEPSAGFIPAEVEPFDLWAIVGFSGLLHGTCEVRLTRAAARFVAVGLLGTPVAANDLAVADTVGELCNMIAGGWKNRTPALSAFCTLSPPTLFHGRGDVRPRFASQLARTYQFEDYLVRVTLACDPYAAV